MEDIELLKQVIDYNKSRYNAFKNGIVLEKNIEFERILSARYMKVSRVKRRLIYLLSRYRYIWFCTFTFDNELIKRCARTKKDTIKKCINRLDFKYILNIDYGKQTEREHYHCILATNYDLDLNKEFKKIYPCHCLSLLCNTDTVDLKRLTKYINKLSNHCIKATCKRERIIYNFKGYDSLAFSERDRHIMQDLEYNDMFDFPF